MVKNKWIVLYCKSNFEKKIAKRIVQTGIECYLPLQHIKKQWKDRKKWVEELLFHSYIFVPYRSYVNNKEIIYSVEGVMRVLSSNGKPICIDEIEINKLKELCNGSKLYTMRLNNEVPIVGDTIKLHEFDAEGVIEKIINKKHISVYIPSLNTYISFAIS